MKSSDLSEFSLEEEGLKITIKRGENGSPVITTRATAAPFVLPAEAAAPIAAPVAAAPAPVTPTPAAAIRPVPADEEAGIIYIKSPMVGTFYRSSSPESGPLVGIGSTVAENTVVCIIEAMKIMNEIQAEVKGTIVEALVENGQAVEYGQRLFKVKAA